MVYTLLHLLDAGGSTDSFAEIVEFCPADFPAFFHLDLDHAGRLDWEDPLYAFALDEAANGKGFSQSLVATCDDGSTEELNSFSLSFDDLDMDMD